MPPHTHRPPPWAMQSLQYVDSIRVYLKSAHMCKMDKMTAEAARKRKAEKNPLSYISGIDTPNLLAAKTALYYIPALVSLPVIFPGVKQILGRRDGVLGALLSKVKSNFLCPIRPIAQNVAALDFSKLLQKRDGLITISTVTSRYRKTDRYSLPIDQGMNLCVLSSTGPSNTDVPLHRFLGPRLACSDTLLVVESMFSSSSSAFAPSV